MSCASKAQLGQSPCGGTERGGDRGDTEMGLGRSLGATGLDQEFLLYFKGIRKAQAVL